MFGIEDQVNGLFAQEWKKFFLLISFFHWWTIWFVLGRNFTETTFLLSISRISQYLLFVTIPGLFSEEIFFSAMPLGVAIVGYICVVSLLDLIVLKALMRRYRPGFKWNKYDAVSILFAHCMYVGVYLIFPASS